VAVVRRTPVAIVGGGPIGLLLALFLDRHGVPSVVFNTQDTVADQPRGSTHNARTMEHYRRLGLASTIRRLGLPWDHPAGISFATRYSSHPLKTLHWPGTGEVLRQVAGARRDAPTPEPMHRANQMYVERLLFDHACTRPNITLQFGWTAVRLADRRDGVTVTCERDAARQTWQAQYVVGCDGGHSFVRRHLGIRYAGPAGLDQDVLGRRAIAAHLRIPTLYRDLIGARRAWSNWAINADFALNLIALNGVDEFFLLTSSLDPDTASTNDVVDLVWRAAGTSLPVEVLGQRGWTPGAALVAEGFGTDRILLAGDAAHLFTPNGGFGMNTGVDDTANLSWKLAAAVQGWAGPKLLGSYELERRPVALRNTAAARELNIGLGAITRPAALEEDSARGAKARRTIGAQLAEYGMLTLNTLGVQLGACYTGSPIVDAGTDTPPPDSFTDYTPTSMPGCRAPHVWLDDFHGANSALHDRFGTGYTLLCLGAKRARTANLQAAAEERNIPLTVLRLDDPLVRERYERDLVLIRPDQHVAWRGNSTPRRPDILLARLSGG
jgi:2-polyprenyl-6-methoxyphenol hydroxylase-like FAD-dependent oxidoreductase